MLVKYFDMTVIFSMIILMVPSLAIFKYELIRTLVWSHCCNDGRPLGFNNDWVFLGYSTLSTGFTGWTYRNKAVKSKWGEPNMNARFISSQWWIYIALYGVNIRWGTGMGSYRILKQTWGLTGVELTMKGQMSAMVISIYLYKIQNNDHFFRNKCKIIVNIVLYIYLIVRLSF